MIIFSFLILIVLNIAVIWLGYFTFRTLVDSFYPGVNSTEQLLIFGHIVFYITVLLLINYRIISYILTY